MTTPEIQPSSHPRSVRQTVQSFVAHLLHMPRWQKILLALAAVAGAAGPLLALRHPTGPAQPTAVHRAAPGSSYAGGEGRTAIPTDGQPQGEPTPTPWISRLGISIVIGFIVGWLFRTFVRFMPLVAILFGTFLTILSYLHVVNVDLTSAANQHYHDAAAWLTDQAGRQRDAAMAHLPSAGGGFVGMFIGFRRRR